MLGHHYKTLPQESSNSRKNNVMNDPESEQYSPTFSEDQVSLPRYSLINSESCGWLVAAALTILFSVFCLRWNLQLDRTCLERTSFPCEEILGATTQLLANFAKAPALKYIPSTYKQIRFNGSIDFPSIYRGPPSSSIDQAWNKLIERMRMLLEFSRPRLTQLFGCQGVQSIFQFQRKVWKISALTSRVPLGSHPRPEEDTCLI